MPTESQLFCTESYVIDCLVWDQVTHSQVFLMATVLQGAGMPLSNMELSPSLPDRLMLIAFANFSLECNSVSGGTAEILPDRTQVGLDSKTLFCLGFFLSRYYLFIFLFCFKCFPQKQKNKKCRQ